MISWKQDARMAYFLAKTDSEEYSIEQFERDKATVWDGIRNAQVSFIS